MNAERIATALGGRKVGGGWMARCPAHDDREPSLSIRDGDASVVLVRCHAGCDQDRVIAALSARSLWAKNGPLSPRAITGCQRGPEDAKRTAAALVLWESAVPANGTLVEVYLACRGLHVSSPATLRFHARLKHPSGGIWPAMVGLVTLGSDGTPVAIHRTFLSRNGTNKAPVEPQKMMLGPCRGGAVRLAEPDDVLMVGEGIETCLAAMRATGRPAWAALSTSGLRTLALPDAVLDVIVLADGDAAGEAAAGACGWRWKREGRRVRIARPPQGMDFNDMLIGRAPRRDEDAP